MFLIKSNDLFLMALFFFLISKKRFLNLQIYVPEPQSHLRRNNSSQIMLSAPCTMCQAFVWHLLLARQINFKILGKKEGRRGFETVCIPLLVSILTGMTVPLSLEAASALSTSKMLFSGLILT